MVKPNDILESLSTDKPTSTIILTDLHLNINKETIKDAIKEFSFLDVERIVNSKFALIDFSSIEQAVEFKGKSDSILINQENFKTSFSLLNIDAFNTLTDKNIKRFECRVLHVKITKVSYKVTCESLYNICSLHGQVLRIILGKKNNKKSTIDALVEFEKVEDAINVKSKLNKTELFSGGCRMNMEYSRIQSLLIDRIDSGEFCDYTYFCDPYYSFSPVVNQFSYPGSMIYPAIRPIFPYKIFHGKPNQSNFLPRNWFTYSNDPSISEIGEGVVLHCHNLHSGLTCDNVFNLFCLYGNIIRIHKDSMVSALIQMANKEASKFAREMIDGLRVFGAYLNIRKTKFKDLNDKSPSQDYTNDIYNRFKTSLQSGGKRHRVFGPSKTIHFFNVPESYSAEDIVNLFEWKCAPQPDKAIVFPKKDNTNNNNNNNNQTSSSASALITGSSNTKQKANLVSGLVEFNTISEAVDAIILVNHSILPRYPPDFSNKTNPPSNNITSGYHIRLVFSPVLISEEEGEKIACNQLGKRNYPNNSTVHNNLKRSKQ